MPMVFAAIAKGDANHGGGDTALLLSPLCMVRIFGFGGWLGEVNIGIEEEPSALFGQRSIDLVTPKSLNHRIRDQILNSAEVYYVAKG